MNSCAIESMMRGSRFRQDMYLYLLTSQHYFLEVSRNFPEHTMIKLWTNLTRQQNIIRACDWLINIGHINGIPRNMSWTAKLLSMKPETKYDKMDPRRGRGGLTIKLVASQKNRTARASMWLVILKTPVHREVQVLLYWRVCFHGRTHLLLKPWHICTMLQQHMHVVLLLSYVCAVSS